MTDDLVEALRPLLARLEGFLASHPELRRELAAAARVWADHLDPPSAAVPAPAPSQPAVAAPQPVERPPPLPPPPLRAPIPAFEPPPTEADEYAEPVPPGVIAARCRVKADAAQLVADRFGDATGGPLLADLIARAKELPDCFLWMLQPGNYSEDPGTWARLAGAYHAAAAAADMLRTWLDLPPDEAERYENDILPLSAEAQSVLYGAVQAVGKRGFDQDQLELFGTIRDESKERQVFIRRFLKKEDPADPATAPEVVRRVRELTTLILDRTARAAARRKLLGNLRYKLTRLREDPPGRAGEWPRVLELIDKLVSDGLPPSNAELRDLLLPAIDDLPAGAELTRNVGLVFREIGRFLDALPDEPEPNAEAASAEVEEVARLIGGRELVLIGGLARPHHKQALIRAFRLADLDWIVTPDHESYTVFEPAVRRPATAVVVLAIRWSNHSYAEVQTYCTQYHKPLVRLPAGYNPNQMAHQILAQVGDQLRNGTSG